MFLGPRYLEEPLIMKMSEVPKIILSVYKVLTEFILEVHNNLKSTNYFQEVMN